MKDLLDLYAKSQAQLTKAENMLQVEAYEKLMEARTILHKLGLQNARSEAEKALCTLTGENEDGARERWKTKKLAPVLVQLPTKETE